MGKHQLDILKLLYKFPANNDRSHSWLKLKERDWKIRSTKVDYGSECVKPKRVLLMAQGWKYRLQVCKYQEVISNFHFQWHSFPSISLAVSCYCILSVTCTLIWDFSLLPWCSWGLLSSGMLCGIGWLIPNVSRPFRIGPQSNCLTLEDG